MAIYRKGVHLGYVPGDSNATIAQLLRFGHANVFECRIMQVDKKADPWKQVRVGIYVTDNRKQKKAEEPCAPRLGRAPRSNGAFLFVHGLVFENVYPARAFARYPTSTNGI